MATYNFSVLESKFEEIVRIMPDPFDSHQFLLELARQNQVEYVSALYAYRDYVNRESPSPFQGVHKAIIQKLAKYTNLIRLIRDDKPSVDIFGKTQTCAEWEKIKKEK